MLIVINTSYMLISSFFQLFAGVQVIFLPIVVSLHYLCIEKTFVARRLFHLLSSAVDIEQFFSAQKQQIDGPVFTEIILLLR